MSARCPFPMGADQVEDACRQPVFGRFHHKARVGIKRGQVFKENALAGFFGGLVVDFVDFQKSEDIFLFL